MKKTVILGISFLFIAIMANAQTVVEASKQPVDSGNSIFSKVEFEAEFPGGSSGWIEYLQKNLKADVPVRKKAPNGTYKVIVRFIVSKDGTISDIQPETDLGYGMEAEVMRVIRKGPKWIPAKQNGRPVNAYRRQPITFVVSG